MVSAIRFAAKGLWVSLMSVCLVISGCPTAQQWFTIAADLIPIVAQTVSAFTIVNNPLTPQDQASIQAFSNGAQLLLKDIGDDIALAKSGTNVTIIQKIDAEIASLKGQASGVLSALQVKDPAEVAKVSAWIGAILADAKDLADLVPVIQGLVSAPGTVSAHTSGTVIKERVTLAKASSLSDVFKARLANLQ